MRIMGVDPSSTCTGVSLPGAGTMALKPPARLKGDDRLYSLAVKVGEAAVRFQVELAVIEDLAGLYKGEAARVIPMLHGMIRMELKRLGVVYMPVNPTTLKRFATGSASADKTAMALAALKRLGREYATSDECDADWLRIAGRTVYGWGESLGDGPADWLKMPAAQVQALRHGLKGKLLLWPEVAGHRPWPVLSPR